jgi:predicted dehydrogenase
VEKPLAADLSAAKSMLDRARATGRPGMIDFNFPELATWQRAQTILAAGNLGRLRHVVVTWNVENQATRLRLQSWKTRGDNGGGLLGNFVSHCFYYLEWLCGPIAGLTGRLSPLPGTDDQDSSIALALAFASGAGGSLQMSCASFLGSGHRLEFYGDDGTLVLANPTADYFRGFELKQAQRSDRALRPVEVADVEADATSDSRIAPVSRLVRRFLDACSGGVASAPGLAEGYRVQQLIDAARRAHTTGRWIDIAPSQERP